MLEAKIPNQLAYRANLKEIQLQVKKLMSKGFVRESMSSYSMLVLLVPISNGT